MGAWGIAEVSVEEVTFKRGEIKTDLSLVQNGHSVFVRMILQGFASPDQGFFYLDRSGVQWRLVTHMRSWFSSKAVVCSVACG